MRKLRTAAITGAVTLGLAGTAFAATHRMHVMKVDLPDGTVAKVEYAGKIAPTIEVVPADAAMQDIADAGPFAFTGFADPMALAGFTGFDRAAALMDAQSQAIMHQVAAMEQAAAQAVPVMHWTASSKAPQGAWQYTVMTSSNGKQACTRTIEWSSNGAASKPKVTRTSAGDCDAVHQDTTPQPAVAAQPAAKAQLPGTPA